MIAQNSCFYVSSLVKHHWKQCNQCIKLYSAWAQQKTTNEGPWGFYSQQVSEGTLIKDDHQVHVVQQLQKVYEDVVAYQRPVLKQQSGSFFNFFKKSVPQKIIAPNGLYIYGSVGGGKTMLMDLFYETVPVSYLIIKDIVYIDYRNPLLLKM